MTASFPQRTALLFLLSLRSPLKVFKRCSTLEDFALDTLSLFLSCFPFALRCDRRPGTTFSRFARPSITAGKLCGWRSSVAPAFPSASPPAPRFESSLLIVPALSAGRRCVASCRMTRSLARGEQFPVSGWRLPNLRGLHPTPSLAPPTQPPKKNHHQKPPNPPPPTSLLYKTFFFFYLFLLFFFWVPPPLVEKCDWVVGICFELYSLVMLRLASLFRASEKWFLLE